MLDLNHIEMLAKFGEDTKNAEFTGHRDIWQNSQDKEETNKDNSATVLKLCLTGQM